jgi:DNA-binding response OmpR family regulator
MSQHLLMIEDDARLAAMVAEYLQQNGFAVSRAGDGLGGLDHLSSPPSGIAPDLVILDLMLPDIDGLEVCRRIRALPTAAAQVPVLMLTAKGDAMDRIIGLEMGADDYLPKPFEPRELLARIRAILRRRVEQTSPNNKALRFGSLEIDRDARSVTVAGALCDITSYQFDLLVALAERAGRVLSRDQIMEAVRGRELDAFDRSIDVHMGRIRAAIEVDAKDPKRILTVRGLATSSPASRTEPGSRGVFAQAVCPYLAGRGAGRGGAHPSGRLGLAHGVRATLARSRGAKRTG